MTYKPQIRVGVDWDGDGFIHLNGVSAGTPASPIEEPLAPTIWARSPNDRLVNQATYNVLKDDPNGIYETEAELTDLVGRYISMWQKEPYKIWEKPAPQPVFDGYGLTGVNQPASQSTLVTTTNPQPDRVLVGNDETKQTGTVGVAQPIRTNIINEAIDIGIDSLAGTNPTAMYDGNTGTYYQVTSLRADIYLQFSAPKTIRGLKITAPAATDEGVDKVELYYWNGIAYSLAPANQNPSGWNQQPATVMTFEFPNDVATTDYFIRCENPTTGDWGIAELEVYEYDIETALDDILPSVPVDVRENSYNQTFKPIASFSQNYVDLYIQANANFSNGTDDAGGSEGSAFKCEITDSFGNALGTTGWIHYLDYATEGYTFPTSLDWVRFTFPSAIDYEEGESYTVSLYVSYGNSLHQELLWGIDEQERYYLGSLTRNVIKSGATDSSQLLVDGDAIFQIQGVESAESVWDGNTIFSDLNSKTITVYLGTNNPGIDGYSGISVVSGQTYTFQFWIQYTSPTREACTNPTLTVEIDDGTTPIAGFGYASYPVIDPATTDTLPEGTWIPVAFEFTAINTGTIAFGITFSVDLVGDGGTALTGFMLTSSDWGHDFSPLYTLNPTGTVIEEYSESNADSSISLQSSDLLPTGAAVDQTTTGTITASTWTSSSTVPTNMVDDAVSRWQADVTGSPVVTLTHDFGVSVTKQIVAYTLRNSDSASTARYPTAWTFLASNTGAFAGEEVTLDTQTGQSWAGLETKEYTITNPNAYRYYRWRFTSYNDSTYMDMDECELKELTYITADIDELAQSFQLPAATPPQAVKLRARKVGTPTGTVSVGLFTDVANKPSVLVSANASGTFDEADLTTDWQDVYIYFPALYTISASTTYWLKITTTRAASETDYIEFAVDSSAPAYADGLLKYNDAGVWDVTGHDLIFSLNTRGVSLPVGWVSPSFYTPTKTYEANEFWNLLDAGTTYKVGFFAKADSAQDVTYVLRDYQHGTTTYEEFTGTLNLTTDYQFFSITGSVTPANAHSFIFTLQSAVDLTVTVKGLLINRAQDAYAPIVSDTAQYDLIGDTILHDLDWRLGKKGYYEPLAYEGTMTIEVNNESRTYSPANQSSPLYGKMKQNLKAIVQVKNSSNEWVTMWSGWTEGFNARVGTTENRKAEIRCIQGMYRLREGEFSWKPQDDLRIDEVLRTLISYSGWRTTITPKQWWLSLNTQLGIDTYLVAESDIWKRIDEGESTYDMIGDGWNNKTSLESALKDLLSAEDGVLWVTRDGYLEFRNRSAFLYFGEAKDTINIDTLTSANYSFGEEVINQVEVFMTPKTETQSVIVWQTKENLIVDKGATTEPILLTFEYEEGSAKTVDNLQLNQKDMAVAVYRNPSKRRMKQGFTAPEAITDDDILDNVTIKTVDDGAGRIYLTVTNENKFTVYVSIAIYGDIIKGGEGISYNFEDAVSIANYAALHKVDIKTKIATTYQQAKALAELRLIRNADPVGEFTWIEIISSDATKTDQILDLSIGDIILLSETQTGEVLRPHVILGETVTIKDGLMFMKYDLAFLPNYTFMHFGQSLSPNSIFSV